MDADVSSEGDCEMSDRSAAEAMREVAASICEARAVRSLQARGFVGLRFDETQDCEARACAAAIRAWPLPEPPERAKFEARIETDWKSLRENSERHCRVLQYEIAEANRQICFQADQIAALNANMRDHLIDPQPGDFVISYAWSPPRKRIVERRRGTVVYYRRGIRSDIVISCCVSTWRQWCAENKAKIQEFAD
jgi:hypothetical protein